MKEKHSKGEYGVMVIEKENENQLKRDYAIYIDKEKLYPKKYGFRHYFSKFKDYRRKIN